MNKKLFEAAKRGDCAQINYWLDQGADIEYKNADWLGASPLFAAVSGGSEEAVSLLIARGANVNATNQQGWPPLRMACERLSTSMITILLSAGATFESECVAIAERQSAPSEYKSKVLLLLKFAASLDAIHRHYFLPIIYSQLSEEDIQGQKRKLLSAFLHANEPLIKETLNNAYHLDKAFHLRVPVLIRQIVRRYGMDAGKLTLICDDLLKEKLQENKKLLVELAKIVHYAVEQGADVPAERLMSMIDYIQDDLVSHELVWAIIHLLNREGATLFSRISEKKLADLMAQLNHPARQLLIKSVESNSPFPGKKKRKTINIKTKQSTQKASASVSKQLHASKVKNTKKESIAEKDIDITSFIEALKNRKRGGQRQSQRHIVPSVSIGNGGSDQTWYFPTYSEVESLHAKACGGKNGELKSDDLDKYLPSKFLANGKKWFTGGAAANFFIDRMICHIFSVVSKKQKLNPAVTNKLFMLLDDNHSVRQILFNTNEPSVIAKKVSDSSIIEKKYEGRGPLFITNIAKRLFEDLIVEVRETKLLFFNIRKTHYHPDSAKVMAVVNEQIEEMREEALESVYYCVLKSQSVLTAARIKKIEPFLNSSNRTLKRLAIKTLGLVGNSQDIDHKRLFSAYLAQLEETTNADEINDAINYIAFQSQDESKAKELLNEAAINKIIELIGNSKLSSSAKITCVGIVEDYLNLDSVQGLSKSALNLVFGIIGSSDDDSVVNSGLNIVLLHLSNSKSISKEGIINLLAKIKNLDARSQNLLIMILSKLEEKINFDINLIAFKLLDQCWVVQDEVRGVQFVTQASSNSSSISVDMLVAKIISDSIQVQEVQPISKESLGYLVKSLAGKNEQTRVYSAKSLYFAIKRNLVKEMISLDELLDLQPATYDPAANISVYTTYFYVHGLLKHSSEAVLIPSSHLDLLSKIYTSYDLMLGTVDYRSEVSSYIVDIIKAEAKKSNRLDGSVFDMFVYSFTSVNGDESGLFNKWLDILHYHVVVNKQSVPKEVTSILENYLLDSTASNQVLKIIMAAIKNRHQVGDKSLNFLKNALFESENKDFRRDCFDCLAISESTQDLPGSVFHVFEMEKVARVIALGGGDQDKAWSRLDKMVNSGERLTLNAFESLTSVAVLKDEAIKLIKNVVNNGQPIPSKSIEYLASAFSIEEPNLELLSVFFNIIKNNQDLPKSLCDVLESMADRPDLEAKILPIFIFMAQRGEKLSPEMTRRIVAVCSSDKKDTDSAAFDLKYGCVEALVTFVQKRDSGEYILHAERIFIAGLADRQPRMRKVCLKGLNVLKNQYGLSSAGIQHLSEYMNSSQGSTLNESVFDLLRDQKLDDKTTSLLCLMKKKFDSDEDCLMTFEEHSVKVGLLQSNFEKISDIILSRQDLHLRVLTLLSRCPNLDNMPANLISHLKVLKVSSKNAEIEALTTNIIKKSGASLGSTIAEAKEEELDTQDRDNALLTTILGRNVLTTESLKEIKLLIYSATPDQLNKVTSLLVDKLYGHEGGEVIHSSIIDCLTLVVHLGCDPTIVEPVFLDYLDDEDSYLRHMSFSIFNCLEARGHRSDKFAKYCQRLTKEIVEETDFLIKDRTTLQVVNSAGYIDPSIVSLCQKSWVSAIIFSDWVEKWQLSRVERLALYQDWAEQELSFDKPDSVLALFYQSRSLLFAEMKDIIRFLPNLSEKEIRETLIFSGIDSPYEPLRQRWLKSMLVKKLGDSACDETFIHQLAEKMAKQCKEGVAEKLISLFNSADTVLQLNSLVDFVSEQGCSEEQLASIQSSADLKRVLQIKLLSGQFSLPFYGKISHILGGLLDIGWTQDNLNTFISFAFKDGSSSQSEAHLLHVLNFMVQYKFPSENYHKVFEILENKPSSSWLKHVNCEMVKQNFSQTPSMKNPEQIVQDLARDNAEGSVIGKLVENGILSEINFIQNPHAKVSGFYYKSYDPDLGQVDHHFYIDQPISQWSREQISSWANAVKQSENYFSDPAHLVQALAVINRANFLLTGFNLTNTQLLACLVAFQSKQDLGRLLQVQTGEGKTIIISSLAIIKALQGKFVDVVTSSPVEAERCVREQKSLYHLFGISVSDNLDRSTYVKGEKKCYKSEVVYGEIAQFQFDTLRDEYGLLGTRAGRPFSEMIGDEVDNSLIDDSTKVARLSSPVAGIDQLQPVYCFLHWRVTELVSKIHSINDQMYLFPGKVVCSEEGKLSLEYFDNEEKKQKFIPDLKEYLKTNKDISHIGEPIQEEVEAFIEKKLKLYFEELVENKKLYIPVNFASFVDRQLPKWIKNAMSAYFDFQEKAEYLVHDKEIKPVEFDGNGTIQNSTQWGDGLHQFLQLEHGAAMTAPSPTTNYCSNRAYVARYGSNVCGFTGTLGPKTARENLAEAYKVDCVEIPSSREKQYKNLPTQLTSNHSEWMSEVCFEALHEVKKSRGVLIICKTIKEVQELESYMKSRSRSARIKTYTMNGCNQEREIEKIFPGDIIIATSLAGRGFDIKASELNQFGGMHVILTYLADDRNQKQAIYRTSRQGNLGSGRQILNKQSLLAAGYVEKDFQNLEEAKARHESKELNALFGERLTRVKIKDELFKKFCALVTEVRRDIRSKSSGLVQDIIDTTRSLFVGSEPSVREATVVSAMEEPWAMFLKDFDDEKFSLEEVEKEYEQLEKKIRQDYKDKKIIQNPCHHIAIGNDLLVNAPVLKNVSQEALAHFEAAIRCDERSSAAAYVGLAWIHLKLKKGNEGKGYKHASIDYFIKAREILTEEKGDLEGLHALALHHGANQNSELSRQFVIKQNMLGSYINAIESCINVIKRSQRLITVEYVKKYQNHDAGKENYSIKKQCELVRGEGLERKKDGTVDMPLNASGSNYSVTFHDLTVLSDMGSPDQAVNTINSALKGKGDEKTPGASYSNVRIVLPRVDLGEMQAFLSSKIEFNRISKLVALEKLEQGKSFLSRGSGGLFGKKMVKVSVFSGDRVVHEESEKSYTDAIALLNTVQEDHQVSLVFKNENKTVKSLNTTFSQLSQAEASEKVKGLHYKSVNVSVVGDKDDLLNLIQALPELNAVQVINPMEAILLESTYTREAALKRMSKIKADSVLLKLDNVNDKLLEKLLSKCESLKINLEFKHVNVQKSGQTLESGQAEIHFAELKKTDASELVSRLRQNQTEFSVCFDQLNKDQVKHVIKNAKMHQQAINISKVRPVSDLYSGQKVPEVELNELVARGLGFTLDLNEKKFIPWWSLVTLCSLASVQISVGAFLVATGFGYTVGMGVITEGVADLATAGRAAYTRHFTWQDYCQQKAISLVISATTMGWSAIKDAGRGVSTVVSNVNREAWEQAAIEMLRNGKSLGKIISTETKQLVSALPNYIGFSVGETAAREVLNNAADTLSNFCFEKFKPRIAQSVSEKVQVKFGGTQLEKLIRKWHAIDKIRGSSVFSERVNNTIYSTMDPRYSIWREKWNSVGLPVIRGILSSQQYLGSRYSTAMQIISLLKSTHHLATVIGHFHQDMLDTLQRIDDDALSMTKLLMADCGLNEADAVDIASLLKSHAIDVLSINLDKLYSIDFGQHHAKKEQVQVFLRRLVDEMQLADLQPIVGSVSSMMTDHIIGTIEGQLVAPLTSYVVASGVNSLSAKIQNQLIRSALDAEQKADQATIGSLEAKAEKTDEERNTLSEKKHEVSARQRDLDSDTTFTYANRLEHHAREKSIAHSQCSMFYHLKTSKEAVGSKKARERVTDYASGVAKDAPADFLIMKKMAEDNGVNLKIVDQPDYCLTDEDRANNVRVAVFVEGKPGADGKFGIGHWQRLDKEGQLVDVPSDKNNCGYAVMSELTGKSIDALRQETSTSLLEHAGAFEKSFEVYNWIASRNPDEANRLLGKGGKKKKLSFEKKPWNEMLPHEKEWWIHGKALQLSDAVYGDGVPEGCQPCADLSLSNIIQGLKVQGYQDKKSGVVYISFRGTDNLVNVVDDIAMVIVGKPTIASSNLVEKINQWRDNHPNTSVVLAGHSLGASLASYVSHKTKLPAVVFDNPGLRNKKYKLDHVTSYQSRNNVVNRFAKVIRKYGGSHIPQYGKKVKLPFPNKLWRFLAAPPGLRLLTHRMTYIGDAFYKHMERKKGDYPNGQRVYDKLNVSKSPTMSP